MHMPQQQLQQVDPERAALSVSAAPAQQPQALAQYMVRWGTAHVQQLGQ